MAVQEQGMAIYQLSSFRLIACEFIIACFCMLRLLRSWCWSMPLRERQPCTHVHACMNTYTHILPYVHRHAQHEHSLSHTYINTHTHKLTLTHTTHIHHLHTNIHINSPTIAFSYFLFPCSLTPSLTHSPTHPLTRSLAHSLTRSLTHSHSHSLTCACTYIHTR